MLAFPWKIWLCQVCLFLFLILGMIPSPQQQDNISPYFYLTLIMLILEKDRIYVYIARCNFCLTKTLKKKLKYYCAFRGLLWTLWQSHMNEGWWLRSQRASGASTDLNNKVTWRDIICFFTKQLLHGFESMKH